MKTPVKLVCAASLLVAALALPGPAAAKPAYCNTSWYCIDNPESITVSCTCPAGTPGYGTVVTCWESTHGYCYGSH
jgi:hypothetical protein